jgi:hypothetical protein
VIQMTVTVPLELPEQLALERVTHAVLDPVGVRDWTVSVVPFMTVAGGMLEVADGAYVDRRLLDAIDPIQLEMALRRVVSRLALAG